MKNISRILTIALSLTSLGAFAGAKEQALAWKLHNRIAGVPPTPTVLATMEGLIIAGNIEGAATEATNNKNFYNVTLKNWVKPWSNRDQNPRVPLNDYVATIVGMIRDNVPFDQVLYSDILYDITGAGTAYASNNNTHYEGAETAATDLMATLRTNVQSALNGLPSTATAGVITSRNSAENFYSAGTNRRVNRYVFINFLCKDYEELHDISIADSYVSRDVERNPGGDSRTYLTKCVGCHAGQDALRGAHAFYDFKNGALAYTPGVVVAKINANNSYNDGYVVTDDKWVNTWAQGQNAKLGWRTVTQGNGAKSIGRMFARSRAFSVCMAQKAFQLVCIREAKSTADKATIETLATSFEAGQAYNMKNLIVKTSAGCVTNE